MEDKESERYSLQSLTAADEYLQMLAEDVRSLQVEAAELQECLAPQEPGDSSSEAESSDSELPCELSSDDNPPTSDSETDVSS